MFIVTEYAALRCVDLNDGFGLLIVVWISLNYVSFVQYIITVNSEIFARILFSRVVFKAYLPRKKFATSM